MNYTKITLIVIIILTSFLSAYILLDFPFNEKNNNINNSNSKENLDNSHESKKSEKSENKIEGPEKNDTSDTFYIGGKIQVKEYSNPKNEEIYHYYNNPTEKSIIIDEAFPRLQVYISYEDDISIKEASDSTVMYNPLGEKVSNIDSNRIEIEKNGQEYNWSRTSIKYVITDPMPGKWRIETENNRDISIQAESYSDYEIDLESINMTYNKGENIRILPDIYLSDKTDAKIKSGKFLLTKSKWSEDGDHLMVDKAYLFNLNNSSRKGINGRFIVNSARFEKSYYTCKYIIKLDNNVEMRTSSCSFEIE